MREIIFIRQSTEIMGGVEQQIVQLAEKLSSRRYFKPTLITDDRNSNFAKTFSGKGLEVLSVPISRGKIFAFGSFFLTAKKIALIIKDRNAALVQTHLFRETIIGRFVRRLCPDVPHIVRSQTYISHSNSSPAAKNFYYLLERMTQRYVDFYIANGSYLKDELVNRSGICPSKIAVVLNGREAAGGADKATAEPQPLPPKIAMIANFTAGKGHNCLIRALSLLKKRGLKIEAFLIGGEQGLTIEQIKKEAEKFSVSRQLHFCGYQKDIAAALSDIAVVALPSDSEGVPNCILEAMSLRKLVVAADSGGVSELLENGKSGFLHKPKDAAGFAEILYNIFTKNAVEFENMRTAAFERWQNNFTADKMVDNFIEIYKRIGIL